jgi:hypothetical protein
MNVRHAAQCSGGFQDSKQQVREKLELQNDVEPTKEEGSKT